MPRLCPIFMVSAGADKPKTTSAGQHSCELLIAGVSISDTIMAQHSDKEREVFSANFEMRKTLLHDFGERRAHVLVCASSVNGEFLVWCGEVTLDDHRE
jgi:hypothetical protein